MTPEDRFWAKVDQSGDCWTWAGVKDDRGYGRFTVQGRKVLTHRFAYELLVGPIPDGLVIDHLCRNPRCVNPAHLEPVTTRENLLRGNTITAAQVARTHCPQGHPYAGENLAIDDGARRCRKCHRDRERARYQARRKSSTNRDRSIA